MKTSETVLKIKVKELFPELLCKVVLRRSTVVVNRVSKISRK